MTVTEYSEWIAYANLEPFGEERADLRAGIVASTVANCAMGRKGPSLKPKDFMPEFGKRVKNMTGAAMARTFQLFANIHNDRLRKKQGGDK